MTHPCEIDSFDAARRGQQFEGETPLNQFPRLSDLLVQTGGSLRWHIAAGQTVRTGASPDHHFRLRMSGTLSLRCGRCLKAAETVIQVDREYLLVRDEDEAVRRDDLESERDVVVGTRPFSILEWIEDETLLELPPVVFHDHCEDAAGAGQRGVSGAAAPATEAPPTQRPFAGLAGLRSRSGK
ncbi:MAG: hypothetical protein RL322_620 [Pseudomonadota bacterium]|jgi:uncharacterized metal-binding protein YceD (DUF177 family)